ncbi:hypothetical protein TNCV_534681 [Trichonephila clavipes]|nr:hypothetical protein TNCV_534681 [Trichonephila clavipes]
MIIGERLVGASVSRTVKLRGVSRTIVLRVMTAFTNLEPRTHENYSTELRVTNIHGKVANEKTISFALKSKERDFSATETT